MENSESRISLAKGSEVGAVLLKVFRQLDGGTLAEVKESARSFRESGRSGTKIEVEIVRRALGEAGVETVVVHPETD
ncbi:hypothetical protein [Streptomyces sp. NRRL F-4489]|uniref:hypothetical protein n=1 Tax=Streptomyces sp. NRRL F-4489 TaxID=1609095 RepID=UPI00131D01EA|nr:hypothetical protein [Streptomyces sp. NRRL F-4489]